MSTMARIARYPLVERIAYYLARGRAWWHRTTVSGLTLRGLVWLTALAAVVLVLPAQVPPAPAIVLAALLCLLPAALPQGRAVSITLAAVLVLLALRLAAADASLPRVGLAAGIMYLHHSAAALAAQIRTDAVVPLAPVRYWALRAGLVLALSAVVVGLAYGLPAPGWSATGHIALAALAALAMTGALLWPLRGRI